MQDLLPLAAAVGEALKARGETVAVGESSAGGLISAALLAQGGASAYFVGGAVVYTRAARATLAGIGDEDMKGLRPSTDAYARLLAARMRERHGAVWGMAETGAAGPKGNRYGDAAGHCCVAVVGPVEVSVTIETGSDDRTHNMRRFAEQALALLAHALDQEG